MYKQVIKRLLDILISTLANIIASMKYQRAIEVSTRNIFLTNNIETVR